MNAHAVIAVLPEKVREDVEMAAFRNYIASCVRVITENTAAVCNGSFVKVNYSDIINPRKVVKKDAEDIISEVIENAGLEVI